MIDEAVKFLCGDAILTTTLFAYKTLSQSRFLELISTRPVALRHLAAHLETRGSVGPLTDLLVSLGKHEEAALVHYRQACAQAAPDARTRRIKSALQNHFHGHPDAPLVVQHLHLLERLAPVLAADARDPKISHEVGLSLSGGGETAASALLYLCYHHYGKEENLLQSPAAFKKVYASYRL